MALQKVLCMLALIISASAQGSYTNGIDSNGHKLPAYSPTRPPAVPLAVRGPYTSAWQSTALNGTLNSVGAEFWPGNPLGWEGIVQVDGVSYEYLGTGSQVLPTLPNLKSATPLTVSYDSQYSNYTFSAGPVKIEASFLSPVLPKDYCRTSIPLSYLTTSVTSLDGDDHDVKFYSDINAAWITYESNVTVIWDLISSSGNGSMLYTWLFNLTEQYVFAENFQFPEWGNFMYTTSPGAAQNATYQSGYSANLRYNWVMQGGLSDTVDKNYRGSGAQEPAFAFSHDFGSVSNATALYTIGSIQQPIMRYLTSSGLVSLQSWWTKCYGDMFSMIQYHYDDFESSAALGSAWEAQLKADVDAFYSSEATGSGNGTMVYSNSTPSAPYAYRNESIATDQFGQQYIFNPDSGYGFLNPTTFAGVAIPEVSEAESYYSLVALAARQIMGAYVFAIPPTLTCGNDTDTSEPLMFQKEISSDGNVNTVDVMYPAMPFFLYANPDLLRFNLNPLYYNEEQGFYPNGYSMHDLGTNFPNATGHVEGDDEYMPVEESGNMILMTYGYFKFSGDTSYLQQHYYKLTQWAGYLIEFSLIPGMQLSTGERPYPILRLIPLISHEQTTSPASSPTKPISQLKVSSPSRPWRTSLHLPATLPTLQTTPPPLNPTSRNGQPSASIHPATTRC